MGLSLSSGKFAVVCELKTWLERNVYPTGINSPISYKP